MKRSAPEMLSPDWPPALRQALTHVRLALGTASPADCELATADVDWPAWRRWVERHRIGGLLHHRLPAQCRAQLPPAEREHLEAAARATAKLALIRSAELVRLSRLLAGAEVPFLSVKGPLLARDLYGELGQRHAGDLDLLIAPERLATADAAMRAANYRRSQPDFELTPRQWREFLRLKHEFEYFSDAQGVRVELEWRLSGLADPRHAEWFAAARQDTLGGVTLGRLPAELEYFYLFVHGAGHGWFRLFWLVDIALLLARPDFDGAALMALARANRAERSVWQGAWLAERLLGVDVPAALRAPAAQVDRVRRLAEAATRMIRTPSDEPRRVAELFREAAYQLRLRATWAGRAAILRPRLMSPANWKMLHLPDRWFALYYVAAPLLWLRRRTRRQ